MMPKVNQAAAIAEVHDCIAYARRRRLNHQTQLMPISSDAPSGAGARVGLKNGKPAAGE
jgi:hypothetical protein